MQDQHGNHIDSMVSEVKTLRQWLVERRKFVSSAQLTVWRKRRNSLLAVLKSLKEKGYPVHV